MKTKTTKKTVGLFLEYIVFEDRITSLLEQNRMKLLYLFCDLAVQ